MQGADQLMRRLTALGDAQPILRTWQIATVEEAQRLAPRKTGFLQRNIVPGPISTSSAKVLDRAPYAPAQEYGAKPHIIRPKNGKVLAWGGARRLTGSLRTGSSATHFARVVHHPGNKPHPHLWPGARKALDRINAVFAKRWNDAA